MPFIEHLNFYNITVILPLLELFTTFMYLPYTGLRWQFRWQVAPQSFCSKMTLDASNMGVFVRYNKKEADNIKVYSTKKDRVETKSLLTTLAVFVYSLHYIACKYEKRYGMKVIF